MNRGIRAAASAAIVAAATFVIHADTPRSAQPDIELQLAKLFFDDGRYVESLEAYQLALKAEDAARLREARVGVVQSALRIAEFTVARTEAEKLLKTDPQ